MIAVSSNGVAPRPRILCVLLCVTTLFGAPTAHATEADPEIRSLSTFELRERREDVGIGGPIALLSVGGALFLTGFPLFFVALACENSSTYCAADGLVAAGAVVGFGGAGMAIGGGVWLGSRLSERKAYDRELRRRDAGEDGLAPRMTYGAIPLPSGAGFGVGGTF